MKKVFGIDLGTTYSCIAYVDEYGKASVITNEDNEPVTPSVVYFETAENVPVGKIAKESLATDPSNVCSAVKRQMGNSDWFIEAHGVQYRAEEISALILKKLAKDASAKLGEPVEDVVITCPAYFGMAERHATAEAGKIAGLNVKAIINEPTAAAISYSLDKAEKPETVLVYDLGGGTFDVTIIQVVPDKSITVVATDGNHNLGGKDWDEAIRGYLIEQFNQETGVTEDIYDDPETMGDLELQSEKAKIALSRKDTTKVKVNFKGSSATIELTKGKFEYLTRGLLDSTISFIHNVLTESAKKGINSFDKILMVGGSTYMPQVKNRLAAEFPNVPIEVHEPNESVAKGAAMYGINMAIFEKLTENPEMTIEEITTNPEINPFIDYATGLAKPPVLVDTTNVISKSFGVRLVVDDIGTVKCVNVVTKNTKLPVEVTLPAGTQVADQRTINLVVFENEVSQGDGGGKDKNEVDLKICTLLGEKPLDGLPAGLPAGSPVDVIFKINSEGTLNVEAWEKAGGNRIQMSFEIKGAIDTEKGKAKIADLRVM